MRSASAARWSRAAGVAALLLVATTARTEPDRAGHDMPMEMDGQFGAYPMSRQASGTSWQPEATPTDMRSAEAGDWSLRLHGFANVVVDRQSGPRGGHKTFGETMPLGMAALDAYAGGHPLSYLLFVQGRIASP